ncbi:alginate lyase family protein [Muriicola soli]|uniref:alginate lyase family protein n=1 Tax=Muriicola soli TaxID=2507538 RepID=UPI0013ED5E03|nr:alginate lyase family protein [Muriicola soli]
MKRLLITVRYLKPIQIRYQFYYRFLYPIFSYLRADPEYSKAASASLTWEGGLTNPKTLIGDREFEFLNQPYSFENDIDWEISEFGKLWTYNLNYFDFLHQESLDRAVGLDLIENYMSWDKHNTGNEPYPTSLRGMNWIKFLTRHRISNLEIDSFLFKDYIRLSSRLEYHIMGNHLLENGFSLLFAGLYFKDQRFLKLANQILQDQLQEQFLGDGAHFERSPMYHSILLHRILDCINFLKLNNITEGIYRRLCNTATKMISWLEAMCYTDGSLPMVNDSIHNLSFKPQELLSFARSLNIKWDAVNLNESGYRKMINPPFELFADFGNIGPDYIPGHAHSDTFNFEIYFEGKPLIVDTGTSTYELGERRLTERSTISHNTVLVDEKEQSDMWDNFRVGRRAKIIHLDESTKRVKGVHNGYSFLNILHSRQIQQISDGFVIEDQIDGRKNDNIKAEAFIHFHPSVQSIQIVENYIRLDEKGLQISFLGNISKLSVEPYSYAMGYNKRSEAKLIRIEFKKHLVTNITKI